MALRHAIGLLVGAVIGLIWYFTDPGADLSNTVYVDYKKLMS